MRSQDRDAINAELAVAFPAVEHELVFTRRVPALQRAGEAVFVFSGETEIHAFAEAELDRIAYARGTATEMHVPEPGIVPGSKYVTQARFVEIDDTRPDATRRIRRGLR